jgi:hypothetical protein
VSQTNVVPSASPVAITDSPSLTTPTNDQPWSPSLRLELSFMLGLPSVTYTSNQKKEPKTKMVTTSVHIYYVGVHHIPHKIIIIRIKTNKRHQRFFFLKEGKKERKKEGKKERKKEGKKERRKGRKKEGKEERKKERKKERKGYQTFVGSNKKPVECFAES